MFKLSPHFLKRYFSPLPCDPGIVKVHVYTEVESGIEDCLEITVDCNALLTEYAP
jgi:hypothetical protein